ncbi:MAG: hypothetical protein R3277_11950 [Brumimicrobium sp.]|nr:hypothetical protein [Brumimicrobium sp.]
MIYCIKTTIAGLLLLVLPMGFTGCSENTEIEGENTTGSHGHESNHHGEDHHEGSMHHQGDHHHNDHHEHPPSHYDTK